MSFILLSQKALQHNISVIAKKAPLECVYAVLKDNAYGHGLVEFGGLCAHLGMRHAVVRDSKEARQIAHLFESVLVLSEIADFDAPENVEFAVNAIQTIKLIPHGKKVHLGVDSGMHRNGVAIADIPNAIQEIHAAHLELSGVFSHLKSADELSSVSFWQEKNFLEAKRTVLNLCSQIQIKRPLFHLYNTAGLFRHQGIGEFDMARVGIGLYGYLDMPSAYDVDELSPVLSLWGERVSKRTLTVSQKIGYGGMGRLQNSDVSSVYDIGYADGFYRCAAEDDYILPDGSRMLGRVSMDSMSVASDKEQICIFDDASILARRFHTISYDILVKLHRHIKREIVSCG